MLSFVCQECVTANKTNDYKRHCQRHDTWCDCGCRGGNDAVDARMDAPRKG